ncbi:hypothetical protein RHGRI_001477 [Rhododendron griersonianum]|uniref:CCHC-type domain-containing protein n=1 Tax=Rhododendron griersonianum TaxID=479676 RepID=A0AAV6LLD1_9ERIC|nr:hypothetical protein RHGRI_001477 [Rhododendron griersonianum]
MPILSSENFDYWKSRIKAIMRSADVEIWNSCVNGYKCPTKKVDNKEVYKSDSELSGSEKAELQANNRALDILFGAVDENEHQKIANCEIAKEAWDILVTCHEGTDVVKQSKLQRLTTEFETIRMEEEETFNEFYSKLISIVNRCETLGEPIQSFRVIKKILRSLPERFKTKVIMLEGKRKLKEKTVEEVVGILQTFEADMLHSESHKPKTKLLEKTIAFSSSQRENRDSGSDNDTSDETLALLTKNLKRLFKQKSTENMNTKGKGMKGPPLGPKCYECHGYGHLAHECANKLKKSTNFKANLSWDDDSNSDTSVQELEEKGNFMAFVTSLCSQTSDSESSDDSDEDDGVDLKDSKVLREKYD